MFVGESGVRRIVGRTCELMRATGRDDIRQEGAVDLETIQRYINLWFSLSLDLFGGEVSSNAAGFFAAGLKGRAQEEKYPDHVALEGAYPVWQCGTEGWHEESVPLRNAINEVLRDAYIEDCRRCLDRWNRVIEEAGIPFRLRLPDRKFHRQIGVYAAGRFDPEGKPVTAAQWQARKDEFLPSEKDRAFVRNLMAPHMAPGEIANWIAKPAHGIKGLPFEFEYVRREQ
jgi:benzoyl-CoA 2,3-dioxygenase component B